MLRKKIRVIAFVGIAGCVTALSANEDVEGFSSVGEYFDKLSKVKMETRLLQAQAEKIESKQKVDGLKTTSELTAIETRVKMQTINKKLTEAGFEGSDNRPGANAHRVLDSKPKPPPISTFNESNIHFLAIKGDSKDTLGALVRVGSKEKWVLLGDEVVADWRLFGINGNHIIVSDRNGATKKVSMRGEGY